MIRFSIVTIFPDLIDSYTNESILKRAQEKDLVKIKSYNLRDWATDKHRTVDGKVFGGGAGMLLKIEPLFNAVKELKQKAIKDGYTPIVVATSAAGELFSSKKAKAIATTSDSEENFDYIVLCGRYEGFDARINEFVDLSLSIGPYILTGGELSALVFVDAITRLIPNVLGNPESSEEETSFKLVDGKLVANAEHSQYSLPAIFEGKDSNQKSHTLTVPEILRSGHHKKINEYNESQREEKPMKIE